MNAPAKRKRYLDVPYADKDEAKALGARWDPECRLWYIPPELGRKLFRWPSARKPPAKKAVVPAPARKLQRTVAQREWKKKIADPNPAVGNSARLQRELDARLQLMLDED